MSIFSWNQKMFIPFFIYIYWGKTWYGLPAFILYSDDYCKPA